MSRGPLNRVIGTLGLVALMPTAIMSATGHLTAADTAVRAGVTFAIVMAVRKIAGWYLHSTATSFERQSSPEAAEVSAAGMPASASADAAQERRRRRNDAEAADTVG